MQYSNKPYIFMLPLHIGPRNYARDDNIFCGILFPVLLPAWLIYGILYLIFAPANREEGLRYWLTVNCCYCSPSIFLFRYSKCISLQRMRCAQYCNCCLPTTMNDGGDKVDDNPTLDDIAVASFVVMDNGNDKHDTTSLSVSKADVYYPVVEEPNVYRN
ncbi:hypothetical protein BDA99DRAFT_153667 [Phascolomyces articulosus]|uniref:Uncharacterized protein n=1 Tax=Phascolomyces articulosus TaxID=60185 RepID=A0AAD5K593_9FUNG|nr:hypothetical protein BDA99DRAFT_153667 [Phascolomyces articulosus]